MVSSLRLHFLPSFAQLAFGKRVREPLSGLWRLARGEFFCSPLVWIEQTTSPRGTRASRAALPSALSSDSLWNNIFV
jgi:hypothetical protein